MNRCIHNLPLNTFCSACYSGSYIDGARLVHPEDAGPTVVVRCQEKSPDTSVQCEGVLGHKEMHHAGSMAGGSICWFTVDLLPSEGDSPIYRPFHDLTAELEAAAKRMIEESGVGVAYRGVKVEFPNAHSFSLHESDEEIKRKVRAGIEEEIAGYEKLGAAVAEHWPPRVPPREMIETLRNTTHMLSGLQFRLGFPGYKEVIEDLYAFVDKAEAGEDAWENGYGLFPPAGSEPFFLTGPAPEWLHRLTVKPEETFERGIALPPILRTEPLDKSEPPRFREIVVGSNRLGDVLAFETVMPGEPSRFANYQPGEDCPGFLTDEIQCDEEAGHRGLHRCDLVGFNTTVYWHTEEK